MRTTEDRDAMLGKALVQAFQEECGTKHPEVEELAALIDSKLGPDESTRIMGHVASCDRCYELFSMSSEMVKERQEVNLIEHLKIPFTGYKMLLAKVRGMNLIANFKMPLVLAAGILIAIGAFFAYKSLYFPSPEVVALKGAPKKEAPRLSAPAELKEPSVSLTASVPGKNREETKPHENKREGKSTSFHAEVAVNDAVGEFLSDTPDDLVTDKNKIGILVAMLSEDNKSISRYNISEVRIERGEALMRSVRSSAEKAEITIKNGVLTIKLLESDGR